MGSVVSDSAESECDSQKIPPYSALAGLPPMHASVLPGALSLHGNYLNVETAYPGVPPSLPPGLDLWQPDDEMSPDCAARGCLPLPPTTGQSTAPLSSPQGSSYGASGMVLSTVPWCQSAPESVTVTPRSAVSAGALVSANSVDP